MKCYEGHKSCRDGGSGAASNVTNYKPFAVSGGTTDHCKWHCSDCMTINVYKKFHAVAAMVWRICLPTLTQEHHFTGLSEKIDPGDKKYSYEEEIQT